MKDAQYALRWCDWHHGYAHGTALIHVREVGSGPGIMQYACPDCVQEHGLTPLDLDDEPADAEQPVRPA